LELLEVVASGESDHAILIFKFSRGGVLKHGEQAYLELHFVGLLVQSARLRSLIDSPREEGLADWIPEDANIEWLLIDESFFKGEVAAAHASGCRFSWLFKLRKKQLELIGSD
jgi:hypothetical protein